MISIQSGSCTSTRPGHAKISEEFEVPERLRRRTLGNTGHREMLWDSIDPIISTNRQDVKLMLMSSTFQSTVLVDLQDTTPPYSLNRSLVGTVSQNDFCHGPPIHRSWTILKQRSCGQLCSIQESHVDHSNIYSQVKMTL